jgi:hypothetical protein
VTTISNDNIIFESVSSTCTSGGIENYIPIEISSGDVLTSIGCPNEIGYVEKSILKNGLEVYPNPDYS